MISAGTWKRRLINPISSKDDPMPTPHSDALVFFGATGDLAYKQIFAALRLHIDAPRWEVFRSTSGPASDFR